ncbi:MAG: UbiD family decarboxylase, partial [Deltaproteobacteria bacterium]|nr:UbiD family decarboxylase [Deltaproteobacteria bacterium]
MIFGDMREFLSTLEAKGLLKRVKSEVDPHLEISAILERLVKSP